MLTLRQSAFDQLPSDLFRKLEQQLHTAERVPAAEVRETAEAYTIAVELPGVDKASIDVKATDRTLVISAERQAPPADASDASTLLSEVRYVIVFAGKVIGVTNFRIGNRCQKFALGLLIQ